MYSNKSVNLYRKLAFPAANENAASHLTTPIKHTYPQFKEISPEANYAICSYGQAMMNLNLPKQYRRTL